MRVFSLAFTFFFAVMALVISAPVAHATTGVLVNEFFSNPSSGSEWVELYNPGASSVDVSGWKIQDLTFSGATPNGTATTTIAASTSVPAGGYAVVTVSGLNNGHDVITLFDNSDIQMDQVVYGTVAGYTTTVAAPGTDQAAYRAPDGSSTWYVGASTQGVANPSGPTNLSLNPGDSIQTAINTIASGGTITLADGTYTLASTLEISKPVTIEGTSEAGTVIDASGVSGYGIHTQQSNVTIKNVTVLGNSSSSTGSYGLKIEGTTTNSPLGTPNGAKSSGILLDHVRVQNSYRTGVDLNGVTGATLSNINVTGVAHGTGIALTDSDTITLTNITTSGNAWGGVVVFASGKYYPGGSNGITVNGTNSFGETLPLVGFRTEVDNSAYAITNVSVQSSDFPYSVSLPTNSNGYTVAYVANLSDAETVALSESSDSFITEMTTGHILVESGFSLQAAINGAPSGATITVAPGTYDAFSVSGKTNLTIAGTGSGITVIAPTTLIATGLTHKYTPNMQASVFVNHSTGITIQGMTIESTTQTPGAGGADAVVFWNASSGSLTDTDVAGIYAISGAQTGQGIAVDAGAAETTNLTVANVAISGFQKNGIDVVDGNGSSSLTDNVTLTVSGGSITGAGATTTIAQNGIVLWDKGAGNVSGSVDGTAISGFEYANRGTYSSGDYATGILVYSHAALTSVSNSTFSNNDYHIALVPGNSSLTLDATSGNTFDGVSAASATNAELGVIEDKLLDFMTDSAYRPIQILTNSAIATPNNRGIAAAVAAVSSGGMVYAAPGTYNESPIITKSVTLTGAEANADTASRTASGPSESTLKGQLTINANSVTVNGFTLTNPTGAYGVLVDPGTTGTTLTYNLFDSIGSTGQVKGIYVQHGPDNVTITHNSFTNLSSSNGSTDAVFVGDSNTADPSTGIVVDNNTFNGITSNGHGAYGILVNNGAGTGLEAQGNVFENIGSATAGWAHAIGLEGLTPSTTISGNTFSSVTSAGLDTVAVFFEDNADGGAVAVSGNQFNNNAFYGVAVHPDDLPGGSNGYSYTVNASQNWWNSATGPTASGNLNSGTGASAGAQVTYRPWCIDSACTAVDTAAVSVSGTATSPVKGGETVTVTLTFNKNPMNTAILPVVVAGFSSGTTTVAQTSYSGNTWTGIVSVPAMPHTEQTVYVEVSGAEDSYGNQLSGTSTPTSFTADTAKPTISAVDVTQTGTNPNWLKIGDSIFFTVTPGKTEPNATVAPSDYNGVPLNWATSNGGNTYVGSYGVTEGDVDQASPVQLTDVTLTDEAGNVSFTAYSTDVTKGIDANRPAVTLPSAIYASTTPVATGATASDLGSGLATYAWTSSDPSHVTFSDAAVLNPTVIASADGSYTLTLVVTDVAGNSATETTTFYEDTAAPSITPGANISGNEATSHAGAVVTFTNLSASDALDTSVTTTTCDPASGSTFAFGTTTVTCTASDNAGNTATSTFDIGVVDTTAPTITVTGNDPLYVAINNTFVDPGASVTDNYDNATNTTAIDAPDMSTAGTYTLHYDYTDSNGNAATEVTRSVVVEGSSFTLSTTTSGTSVSGKTSAEATTTASSGGVTATFDIPAGTTVTGTSTWDGVIHFPTVTTSYTSPTNPSGFTNTVTLAVEVGSTDALTFDKGVRILFSGQSGNHVGWSRNGTFTEITDTCTADSQTSGDALAAGADCKINVGSDLVVWTKHFTTFLSYTQTANPVASSGGGGGGGGGGIFLGSVPISTPSTSSAGGGEVLGAAAYNFTQNLTVGSSGQDVTELQKILIAEGDLAISAPTGYFGALTKAAVVKYQAAHTISPQSGYVGPLTRAVLNQGVVSTTPETSGTQTLTDAQIQAIVGLLQSFNADASVIANVEASLKGH